MEREFTLAGSWYADEPILAVADRDTGTAGCGGTGQWENHAASLQGSPDPRKELLPPAEGIRRTKTRSAQTPREAGAGEREAEAAGSRDVAGEANSEGRRRRKLLSPERRCGAVRHARKNYRVSERHSCRLLEHRLSVTWNPEPRGPWVQLAPKH
jgi:hypothetical protein